MTAYALLWLFVIGSISTSHDRVRWSWICRKEVGICERVQSAPSDVQHELEKNAARSSLKLCRLTCGSYGALWPRPTLKCALSDGLVKFHPSALSFHIRSTSKIVAEYLEETTKIFHGNVVKECGGECDLKTGSKVAVHLITDGDDVDLKHESDESYFLSIGVSEDEVHVRINGRTVFGVRHGLETLSQLISSYETHSYDTVHHGLVIVSHVEIHDKPVYAHRGLLLDTGRNFLPLETIKRQIDGMAASKMNVLHWHVTDTQSFPLVSLSVPQLARYGAYSHKEVYMPRDVKNLLKYAKLRGVRIILEIDTPSHSGNGWQFGNDEGLGDLVLCLNQKPWRQYCIQPPCGQLNPINENVYSVLGELFSDVIDTFPRGEFFHMGGDELFIPCWNSSESIVQYLSDRGRSTDRENFLWLWGEFQRKALEAFDSKAGHNDTSIIVWSSGLTDPEVIANYLDRTRYIIQTWVPSDNTLPLDLLQMGYKLIISTKDAWYLDHGFWGRTVYHDWRSVYQNVILRHSNVLGGEVCMWGEYVDQQSIDAKVWPRAAAAAERLWSDPYNDTSSVEPRFYNHRERLITRGLNPDGLAPKWCVDNEGECT